MEQLSELFICPKCKVYLIDDIEDQGYICLKCNSSYPILANGIPILVLDSERFLTNTFIQYERYIRDQSEQAHDIGLKSFWRSQLVVQNIVEATSCNLKLISEIKNNIQSHVSVDALLNFILSKSFISSQYFSDFNYLRRDWCGENDDEIKLITDYLIEYIPKDETDKPILFLGAGLARIPCNLANIFSNIYAVDNSVTMANLFFKVKSQDIDFYEIVYKNAASASDMVSRLTASSQFIPKEQMKKIKYIVSDGNHLPFPDNFFSNIVSVYFSDVTPFPELLRELNRVLINKGNFIHLGPLEYHFRDRSSMYSYDELKDVLKKNNYSIEKETSIELPHCLSHNEKSKKLYTNWVFLAKKREVSQTIENNSIFKLLVDIKFEQKIQLSSKDCIVLTEAIMPNGERFEGAEAILDFLRLVDGKRNFSEIISHLESEYGAISDLDRSKFITILNTLLSKSLLAKL